MKKKALVLDFFIIIIGSALYAISVNAFTAPNNIAPGGITGIATLLNFLFNTPIGLFTFIFNLPLVIWAIVEIGYKLVLKSAIGIITTSICIDALSIVIPAYNGDPILVAIFGGLLQGVGLGLVFTRGATTGGTDIVANILSRRKKHLSIGKLMLMLDGCIIVISAFVYHSLESAMYACIVVFVAAKIIDSILYGVDAGTGKMFFVFTDKSEEIADTIFDELNRGVTFLMSKGAYTGQEKNIVFCAVRRFEVHKIQEIIKKVDSEAFVIVGDAGEITGEGFKTVKHDDKTLKELLALVKKGENKSASN